MCGSSHKLSWLLQSIWGEWAENAVDCRNYSYWAHSGLGNTLLLIVPKEMSQVSVGGAGGCARLEWGGIWVSMQQVERVGWAEPGGLGVWVRVGLAVVAAPAVWTNLGCVGAGGACWGLKAERAFSPLRSGIALHGVPCGGITLPHNPPIGLWPIRGATSLARFWSTVIGINWFTLVSQARMYMACGLM